MPYANKDEYNAWKRNHYRLNQEKQVERKKRYQATETGKAVLYKSIKAYRQRDPAKQKARWLLQAAIKRGKIVRLPCVTCGATPAQGHHYDYNKPYDVVWLCKTHHGLVHRKP
jgi:hypothetical protein